MRPAPRLRVLLAVFPAGLLLVVITLAVSCQKQGPSTEAPADNTVATIGSNVITREAFERELARRGALGKGRVEPPAVLEEMIGFEALFQVAAVGDFAPLVETERGFYVVRLAEVRGARVRPFEEVRDTIHYRLVGEAQARREEALLVEAKAGLDLQINHDLLNSLRAKTIPNEVHPPALPGPSAHR